MSKLLFTDIKIYNILNDFESFDYNWVNYFYNIHSDNISDVYQIYLNNNLVGNDMKAKNICNNIFIHPDGMIEHAFERITYNICKQMDLNKYVIKIK